MTPEPMPHLLCNAWGLSTTGGASPSRNAAPGGLCPTRANPDLGPALSLLITDGRITPLRPANLPALPAAFAALLWAAVRSLPACQCQS
ncbi:hypothetical protein FJTKL_03540 [Diaporthe vaccinii]|uniref:Uncharacterized protein n=1 Tax=Diaporthe vaccinii TaxID=105482 RepID=A0ABR4DV96_9PEZI